MDIIIRDIPADTVERLEHLARTLGYSRQQLIIKLLTVQSWRMPDAVLDDILKELKRDTTHRAPSR